MTTRLTIFRADLVQDSAISVSGLDRVSNSDQPFTIVAGVPILAGSGLKGAALAMARRFFDPLPRAVSETIATSGFRRSCWEFANTRPINLLSGTSLRAGVGIRQSTGARAEHVLYDRETIPTGTRWPLEVWVDWSFHPDEAQEAEGILGYVLATHWAHGRCWLGGGPARGLGWCHLENLKTYRLDHSNYEKWVKSDRESIPKESGITGNKIVLPTRNWCFQTLDLKVTFGEYRPDAHEPAWGVDMYTVGPHDSERASQEKGDGIWAGTQWTPEHTDPYFSTDRALLMDRGRPLLPGSSIRGPMRHTFSRAKTVGGATVQDPHPVQGAVDENDLAGNLFGTVAQSSSILIRDARAEGDWYAALLQMHAEDEFSASTFESAKRDGVRLLRGTFPIRIVVEGPDQDAVDPVLAEINSLIALGQLGHLPVGGHKTRGAGWGKWESEGWKECNVVKGRTWKPTEREQAPNTNSQHGAKQDAHCPFTLPDEQTLSAHVVVQTGQLESVTITLMEACLAAKQYLNGDESLVAWWCEPSIDLDQQSPPATFGYDWPDENTVRVDEVIFCTKSAVWRAARTASGVRWVFIKEVSHEQPGSQKVIVKQTPAKLHGSRRFSAANTGRRWVLLREWYTENQLLGYTICQVAQGAQL